MLVKAQDPGKQVISLHLSFLRGKSETGTSALTIELFRPHYLELVP